MKNYHRLESCSTVDHSEDVTLDTLCWENISVWKKCPKTRGVFRKTTYEEVQLLNDVNGFARSGSLVALMGSSGSGKTTLLASISRRLTEGFYGDIYMNGEVINRSRMIKISGFIPQTYLTMDYFTVYEHMYFMARMKMDIRTSEIDRSHRISKLLNQFGLDTCYSTLLHQLSGGERKRLSIATEMLTDPQILFCDEPTTGLDSWNASSVISALRKFCSLGKIVICSIHQPASGIFDLFDDVILLATGGRAAYSGPVNKTTEYFERLQYKCPPSYNVAEFLINIISVSPKRHIRQVKVICDLYAASGQAAKVKDQIKSTRSTEQKLSKFSSPPTNSPTDSRIESVRHVGILTQSYLLTCRSLTDIRRHYKVGMIPYIVFLEHRQQNIGGYLSIFIYDSSLLLSHMLLNSLIDPQSSREIRSGLYTIQAHYLSCIIGVTCKTMVFTTLLVIVSKNLTDCFEYLSYSQMAIVLYIFISSAIALGCLVSAISDDVVIYPVIMNVYDIASQCVGGVYSSLSGLTIVAKYAKYLFLTYYARQAIMVLEWETIDIEEMKQFNVSFDDPAAFRHLKTLAQQGLSIYDYKYNLYVLSAFAIICHCIAYILVARNSRREAVY